MAKLKELTTENREKIIYKLRNKFKKMNSYMMEIDSLTRKLAVNKEEDIYDWKEDNTLRVNQPDYDPKKD